MEAESESLIGTDWIIPNARERERGMAQVDGSELWFIPSWSILYLSIHLAT